MVVQRPVLVRWPEEAARREQLAFEGVACLLVVAPGSPVPVLTPGEDWISRDSDERDVAARLAGVAGADRAPRSTPMSLVPPNLTTDQHRVARVLIASVGALVPVTDLPVADLARVISSLRRPLRREGFRIHAVGASGYLLEQIEQPLS